MAYTPPYLTPEQLELQRQEKALSGAGSGMVGLTQELAGAQSAFTASDATQAQALAQWEDEEKKTHRNAKRVRAEVLASLGKHPEDLPYYESKVLPDPSLSAKVDALLAKYKDEDVKAIAQRMIHNIKNDVETRRVEVLNVVKQGGERTPAQVDPTPEQKIKMVYGGEGSIQLLKERATGRNLTDEEIKAYDPRFGKTEEQARGKIAPTLPKLHKMALMGWITHRLPSQLGSEAEAEKYLLEQAAELSQEEREATIKELVSLGKQIDSERAKAYVGVPEKQTVAGSALNALSKGADALSGATQGAMQPLFDKQAGREPEPGAFEERPGIDIRSVAGVDVKQAGKDIADNPALLYKMGKGAVEGAKEGWKGHTASSMQSLFMQAQDRNLDLAITETRKELEAQGLDIQGMSEDMLIAKVQEKAHALAKKDLLSYGVNDPAIGDMVQKIVFDPLWVVSPAKVASLLGRGLTAIPKVGPVLEKVGLQVAAKAADATKEFRYLGREKALVSELRASGSITKEEGERMLAERLYGDARARGQGTLRERFVGEVVKSEQKYHLPLTQLGLKFSKEEKELVSAALHGDEPALKAVQANDKLRKYYEANIELTKKDRELRAMVPEAHQTIEKALDLPAGKPNPQRILAGTEPGTEVLGDFERSLLANAGEEVQTEFFKDVERSRKAINASKAGKIVPMKTKEKLVGEGGYGHPQVLRVEKGVPQDLVKEARSLGFDSVEEAVKALDNPDHFKYSYVDAFSKSGKAKLRRIKELGAVDEAAKAEGRAMAPALAGTARKRTLGKGYEPDPSEQWKAATLGVTGTKRAEQVALTNQSLKGMLQAPNAELMAVTGDLAEASAKAMDLSEFHGTKFVVMGVEQGIGKHRVSEFLRSTGKPGELAQHQYLVVPEAVRDVTEKLYPEFKRSGPAAKFASGVMDYVVSPLMNTWRLTTTAMIPAFATTNATGAAEMAFLADGIKAANPGLQGGAAATALAAYFHGSAAAKAVKFPIGGQLVSFDDLAKMMTEDGVIGLSGGRFGEDLGSGKGPLSWLAAGVNTASRATGLRAVNQIIDDYQHATVYLSRLKGLDRASRMEAANSARALTGNYYQLSEMEQKLGVPKLFAFYGWNRFYLPRVAKSLWTDPARVSFFDKIKKGLDQEFSPATPNSLVPGEALPQWQQTAGVYTAPPSLQDPNRPEGDKGFVVQTFQTPSQYFAQALARDKEWGIQQLGPISKAFLALSFGRDPTTGEPIPESASWLQKYGMIPAVSDMRITRLFSLAHKAYRAGNYQDAMSYADLLYLGNEAQFLTPAIEAATGQEIPWSLGRQNYPSKADYTSPKYLAEEAQKAFGIVNKMRSKSLDIPDEEEE